MASAAELSEFARALAAASAPPEYCLFYWQWACMPRTDWASWAQAVGAGLALVIAVGVAVSEARRARSVEQETKRAAELTTYMAILNARGLTKTVAQELAKASESMEFARTYVPGMFDEVYELLKTIDPSTLSTRQARLLVHARAIVATVRGAVAHLVPRLLDGSVDTGTSDLKLFVDGLDTTCRMFRASAKLISKADIEAATLGSATFGKKQEAST